MSEKILKARLVNKHDLEVNWLKSSFIPKQGELVIFDIEVDADGNTLELPEGRTEPYLYERMKIGDGITNVNNLPFATDGYVSYDTEQTLTDEQRAQARANIGAATSAYLNGCYDYYALNDSEHLAAIDGSSLITDIPKAIETVSPTNSSSNALRYLFYSINDLFGLTALGAYTFDSDVAAIVSNFNALVEAECITTNSMGTSVYAYCKTNPNDSNAWRYYHILYIKAANRLQIADYNLRGNNNNFIAISLTDGSIIQDYIFDTDSTFTKTGRGADAKTVGDKFTTLESSVSTNTDSISTLSALVGDTSVSEQINTAITNSVADWSQTDETAPDYIKNKPDENDALELVTEMGLVSPLAASDGSIYTDENGVVYTL